MRRATDCTRAPPIEAAGVLVVDSPPLGEGSRLEHATLVGLVTAIIVERPTCLSCIASKAGVTNLATLRVLERMQKLVRLARARGERCRACGSTVDPVYSIEGPDPPR